MAVLLAPLALAACAGVTVPLALGPTAALGQQAAADGLRIRPLRVIEDSRCPINARCVWEGRLRLLVDATRGDGLHAKRELTLGQPHDMEWGVLTLVAVEPAKLAGAAADPGAYRFTFSFEARP